MTVVLQGEACEELTQVDDSEEISKTMSILATAARLVYDPNESNKNRFDEFVCIGLPEHREEMTIIWNGSWKARCRLDDYGSWQANVTSIKPKQLWRR